MELLIYNIPVIIPILCFVLGIVLCIVEVLMPGFGMFGILGILSLIAGIVLRGISGAPIWELALIVLLLVALFTTMITFAVKSAKSGRLSKSALVLSGSAVDEGVTSGTPDYSFLVGKVGVTATMLRPVGKAVFDGEQFEVVSSTGGVVDCGVEVKVVGVEGYKVLVV